MTDERRQRVANPPTKPPLIWDGECHFCKLWIERWREITAGKVDYATYQEVADRFPEIPRDEFRRAMAFIEPDGEAFLAAEAVYRSLGYRSSRKWLAWSYDHVPGFAAISETAYKFIARHRGLGSTLTRLLWGKDVRPPTYFWARRWFLRALGLTYLVAFASLWVQVDGLVGSNGVSPLNQFLPAVYERFGRSAYSLLPTLCWLDSSNGFLHFLCGGGVVLSLLLILGIAPALLLVVLFVFYLSLTIAGQTFLSFQWDILLLETGFLSIFLAPWRLWPKELMWWPSPPTPRAPRAHSPSSPLGEGERIEVRGSPPDGTEKSKPSPSPLPCEGRGEETLPSSCSIPATTAPVSGVGLFLLKFLLLKLMLMSGVVKLTSGDDCWWNLTALDYHYWSQPLPTMFGWWADKSPEWFKHFSVAFCLVVEIIVPFFIWAPRRPRLIAAGLMIFLQIVIAITGRLEPFRIVNGYGLFRVMTKERGEIVIEGSADGIDWLPYEFKWKPGDVMRAPGWCAPHQLRLDWQMWFAALGSYRENPWFGRLIVRLEWSRDVSRLLAKNPFSHEPPRYIRAMFYRYRFTTLRERSETGAWWKREELREYLPTVSLDQVRQP